MYFRRFLMRKNVRWIGRTSIMLIPVMSGAENGSELNLENRVIAIIMVASTERTYHDGSPHDFPKLRTDIIISLSDPSSFTLYWLLPE